MERYHILQSSLFNGILTNYTQGLLHIKHEQDRLLPRSEWYVRRLVEIPATELVAHNDDLPEEQDLGNEPLLIAICMMPEASRRFVAAQHLQSDIAFKRVVGFYEFEVASMDPDSNTSTSLDFRCRIIDLKPRVGITFCRVFLTRQTAFAHHQVLRHINEVLQEDTGRTLRWRHIHGSSIDDYDGHILNWVVDQHGGQAKGILVCLPFKLFCNL